MAEPQETTGDILPDPMADKAFLAKMNALMEPEERSRREQVLDARKVLRDRNIRINHKGIPSSSEYETKSSKMAAEASSFLNEHDRGPEHMVPGNEKMGFKPSVDLEKIKRLIAGKLVATPEQLHQLTLDYHMPAEEAQAFIKEGDDFRKRREAEKNGMHEATSPAPKAEETVEVSENGRQLPAALLELLKTRWTQRGVGFIEIAAERPKDNYNPLTKTAVATGFSSSHRILKLFNGIEPTAGKSKNAMKNLSDSLDGIFNEVRATPEEKERVLDAFKHDCDLVNGKLSPDASATPYSVELQQPKAIGQSK